MRLIILSLIAFMAGVYPAMAGTDGGDAPNPFTEPSAGQTTTSGAVNATDAADVQPAGIPIVPSGAADGQQSSQNNETKSSNSFYQPRKKDGDSR